MPPPSPNPSYTPDQATLLGLCSLSTLAMATAISLLGLHVHHSQACKGYCNESTISTASQRLLQYICSLSVIVAICSTFGYIVHL